jgi:methylenetetrahydrofolate dehydrogenase (NADP+)/methenyltetrahydrofolate cyclohydrolase
MILYGKPVVEAIEQEIKQEIKKLADVNIQPFLAVILVGSDPASLVYTRKKKEKAESLGMGFRLYHYPETMAQDDIAVIIADLNQNKNVHGIIIQLPLPEGFDTDKLLSLINPEKDVDGLNGGFATPTAGAILELLEFNNIDLKNKKVVLVGHGKLVGQPLEKIFKTQNIDLTVCDSKTEDLKSITLSADIIVSGVGKPNLITADMVSENVVIIDAGTAESSGSTVGDVAPDVYEKVASYSPVPGGVGPITVIKLLKNVVESAQK